MNYDGNKTRFSSQTAVLNTTPNLAAMGGYQSMVIFDCTILYCRLNFESRPRILLTGMDFARYRLYFFNIYHLRYPGVLRSFLLFRLLRLNSGVDEHYSRALYAASVNGLSAFGRIVPYLLVFNINLHSILMSFLITSAIALFTWIAETDIPNFLFWGLAIGAY